MSKEIGQRITSRGLGRGNGNMWWNLPCWSKKSNLLFSEAIRISSACEGPNVCSRTFNRRISSTVSSRVDIVFQIPRTSPIWIISTGDQKFAKVLSPGTWNVAPKCEGSVQKTMLGYKYQNRWKNWPLDDFAKGNQNAENTRFLPIMGVKDVDPFLETCRNQLRTQSERQNYGSASCFSSINLFVRAGRREEERSKRRSKRTHFHHHCSHCHQLPSSHHCQYNCHHRIIANTQRST